MNIELATISDCYLLAFFEKKMWNLKYRGIYEDTMIDMYNVQDHARRFQKMIFMGHQKPYVIWEDKVVKGLVIFGLCEEPFGEYTYEMSVLHTEGYDEELFLFAKEEMKKQGIHEFIVTCNKYSEKEIAFFQQMGGEIIHIDADHRDKSRPQVKLRFQSKHDQ